MPVLLRVIIAIAGVAALLGIGAALSAITGLETGWAELVVVGVVAALVSVRRGLRPS